MWMRKLTINTIIPLSTADDFTNLTSPCSIDAYTNSWSFNRLLRDGFRGKFYELRSRTAKNESETRGSCTLTFTTFWYIILWKKNVYLNLGAGKPCAAHIRVNDNPNRLSILDHLSSLGNVGAFELTGSEEKIFIEISKQKKKTECWERILTTNLPKSRCWIALGWT